MALDINGVNTNLLDKLIVDINVLSDDINEILNQIDDDINTISEVMQSEVCNNIKANYDVFRTNFKIINSNIISYCTDYVKVKNSYIERAKTIANQAREYAQEVERKGVNYGYRENR